LSSSREVTPLLRTLFHCRRGGLIRGEYYIIFCNNYFYLFRIEALSTQLKAIGEKGVDITAHAGKILVNSADQLSLVANQNVRVINHDSQ
jgi:hypothetical protein